MYLLVFFSFFFFGPNLSLLLAFFCQVRKCMFLQIAGYYNLPDGLLFFTLKFNESLWFFFNLLVMNVTLQLHIKSCFSS